MKDNYSEMNVDMEQILFSKEYDELTAAELDEIKDFISSKEDFYLMKNTLMSVKSSFGAEEEIEPDVSSKDKLMKMFNDKNGKVVPMHRPFYLSPVFQIGVAAMFILGIIYFYPKEENESVTAMNEKEEINKEAESAPEEKAEAPAEESMVTEVEAEEGLNEEMTEEREGSNPAAFIPNVAIKKEAAKSDEPFRSAIEELAKAEDERELDNKPVTDSMMYLYSDINRASASKKGKEKAVDADDKNAEDVSVVTNTSPTTATATGGTTAAGDSWDFASSKVEIKESDKKKDGKATHTNTADGLYGLPGKPAADLKSGVSLKDEPALADFLFTAL